MNMTEKLFFASDEIGMVDYCELLAFTDEATRDRWVQRADEPDDFDADDPRFAITDDDLAELVDGDPERLELVDDMLELPAGRACVIRFPAG